MVRVRQSAAAVKGAHHEAAGLSDWCPSCTLPNEMSNPRRIGLISCSKAKLGTVALARDLYSRSDLFRKATEYCSQHLDGWYVLSAKHGLVAPDQVLEPYDLTLKQLSAGQRRAWGKDVAGSLRDLGDVELEAHAGSVYVRALVDAGVELSNPLRGLSIGRRKRWYLDHS